MGTSRSPYPWRSALWLDGKGSLQGSRPINFSPENSRSCNAWIQAGVAQKVKNAHSCKDPLDRLTDVVYYVVHMTFGKFIRSVRDKRFKEDRSFSVRQVCAAHWGGAVLFEQDRARPGCAAFGGDHPPPGRGVGRGCGPFAGDGGQSFERPAEYHSAAAAAVCRTFAATEGCAGSRD